MKIASEVAFCTTAARYDRDRSRLIPGFDLFYRWAVDLVPSGARRLVDLGAGTGLLASFLRARFPESQLHLIDSSTAMLERARARFAGDTRVTFELADYAATTLPEKLDCVASALSIHHLADEAKRGLFRSIHGSLRAGGVFVNAEQVGGPTAELETRYRQHWLEQVRDLGATEEQIEESLYRQRADRCASVEDQLGWMREVGFADADCWFKQGRFAVLAGTKRA